MTIDEIVKQLERHAFEAKYDVGDDMVSKDTIESALAILRPLAAEKPENVIVDAPAVPTHRRTMKSYVVPFPSDFAAKIAAYQADLDAVAGKHTSNQKHAQPAFYYNDILGASDLLSNVMKDAINKMPAKKYDIGVAFTHEGIEVSWPVVVPLASQEKKNGTA
ncbi:MAG: hypothetical protein ACRCUC_02250 [Aestuariivirga sp.]